jgi:hypothetical protein
MTSMTTRPRASTETLTGATVLLESTDVAFAVHTPHQATRQARKRFARDLIASIRRLLDEATSTPSVRLPRSSGYPY